MLRIDCLVCISFSISVEQFPIFVSIIASIQKCKWFLPVMYDEYMSYVLWWQPQCSSGLYSTLSVSSENTLRGLYSALSVSSG
jgi:hypothetical protein